VTIEGAALGVGVGVGVAEGPHAASAADATTTSSARAIEGLDREGDTAASVSERIAAGGSEPAAGWDQRDRMVAQDRIASR
jgi:hypothetical protein